VLFACQPKTQSQSQTNQQPSGENPQTVGTIAESAMVSSTHPLASEVGFNILKKGGNAYDAAIAVQFALAVVYPRAGNIGGGGFAVIRKADGATDALDFREKAPSRASRDMYLDKKGDVIKGLSTIGHRASGVPGSVAGMWELHKKHGSLEWKTLIQPAISLAFEGFELTERGAKVLNENQDEFKEANTYKPWVIREEPWQMGEIIIQKELAGTLAFIRDQGRDGFYKGIVADQIVKEMARGNGIISKEDLENYQALWRTPIEGTYRGHKVIGMPPPSSGGIALLQLLHGADILNLSQEEFHSATHIH